MDCSPPGSSVHGVLQARILEWVTISSFRGSFRPRDRTCASYVAYIGRQGFFFFWSFFKHSQQGCWTFRIKLKLSLVWGNALASTFFSRLTISHQSLLYTINPNIAEHLAVPKYKPSSLLFSTCPST